MTTKYSAVYKQADQMHGSPIIESVSLDAVKTHTRLFLASKGLPGDCVIIYMVGERYRANYYYIVRTSKNEILECRSTNKEAMREIRPYTSSAMPKSDKATVNHRSIVSDAKVTYLGIAQELSVSDSEDGVCWDLD